MRLDFCLVEKNILKSRERAKEHIKKGEVTVNGRTVTKPAFEVSEEDEIVFTGEALKYAGRGGLKLEKALKVFGIGLNGRICMDIGASTGGFTDCMLQNGAALVYAVDVGHGQLDPALDSDSRVVNMEGTNIVSVNKEALDPAPDFFSADVSFVSLKNIIPKIAELMGENSEAAVLIKPQFEAGRSNIGKNGIVKDRKVHISVIGDIISFCVLNGLSVKGLDYSPVSGGDGNIEYLVYITAEKNKTAAFDIANIVNTAFSELRKGRELK